MTCKHLLQGAPDCVFCHRDQLQQEVNGLLVENSNVRGVRNQLLQELSLAEEGLANYQQENARLCKAVWLMQMHVAIPAPCRICGYKGAGFWQPETHECVRRYSPEIDSVPHPTGKP